MSKLLFMLRHPIHAWNIHRIVQENKKLGIMITWNFIDDGEMPSLPGLYNVDVVAKASVEDLERLRTDNHEQTIDYTSPSYYLSESGEGGL